MPRDDEGFQWIDIEDFTPGIHSRAHGAGISQLTLPVGAATPDNTHRCMALDRGGIGPLWHRDYSLNYDALRDGALGSGREYQITGFFTVSPVTDFTSARQHEFFFLIEWIDGTNRRAQLRRHKTFNGTWDTELNYVTTTDNPATDQYQNANFITTRANRASPTMTGTPVVIIGWFTPSATARIWQFPDETAASTTATLQLFTTVAAVRIVGHQGRILFVLSSLYDHGAAGDWFAPEGLVWTNVLDTDTLVSATPTVFNYENASGYTALAQMSANELFAVKRMGGGVRIIGDIDDPTVINLPMLPNGASCIPITTPLGVMYLGASGGVHLWQGGDSAEHISRQLDDFFWTPSGPKLLDYNAVLAQIGTDYAILPRGFVYNLHTKSWWRLEDESLLRQQLWNFQAGYADAGPMLYGSTSSFNATNVPLVYGWDTQSPARSWSWQSHPLWQTRNRDVQVRQIILEASGNGTVVVTVTGRSGATESQTFTVASDTQANRIRKDFKLYGESISVKMVSDSGDTDPAPTVHAIHIGYQHTTQVAA